MAKSIDVITKKRRGRPVTTGKGTLIGVRLLDDPLSNLDTWIAKQKESDLSRPEAIRRLVDLGLTVKTAAATRAARAVELAAKAIDKMADPTAHPGERDQRRRRLTKGPEEFREVRVDRPKAKGTSAAHDPPRLVKHRGKGKAMRKEKKSALEQLAEEAERRALHSTTSRQTIADSQAEPEFEENHKRLKADRLARQAMGK
jgi:hypothetical protein